MKSLLCLIGVLMLNTMPSWADNDDMLGANPGGSIGIHNPPAGALGKYKQYIYEVVGSYWYPEISRCLDSLPSGIVRIRYTVHSDGTLTDVKIIEGENQVELAKISMNALTAPVPFRPFDPEVIKLVGNKYTDDFIFKFKGSESGAASPNTTSGPSPYSGL